MIEKIKALRVQIDGLAQLTKQLLPHSFILDVSKLPKGKKADEFIKEFLNPKHRGITLVDSVEGTNPIVQILESKEIQKAYDSLILAKAWLGKILGELGNPTPYQNDGKRKDVKDIEPTADRTYTNYSEKLAEQNLDWSKMSHIEKVDWLRQEIQHKIHLVEQSIFVEKPTREFAISRTNVYNHLSEARFWLGFELQRIREEQTK